MQVINAFFKAASQLSDPRLRRVLGIGVVLSLLGFTVIWTTVWWLLSALDWTSLPYIGGLFQWMGDTADFLGSLAFGFAVMMGTFILFPAVITVIVGFFLEEVVQAVEAKHYPNEPTPRPQGIGEILATTLQFALLVIGVNLLALPFYLILMWIPPLNLLLYFFLNGYLVSREYYELVALRRLEPKPARKLRRAHRSRLLLAGVILVFVMTIPIVNLITPVLGAAFMVHVYQNLPRRREFTQTANALQV